MNPLILILPLALVITWARLIRPRFNTLEGTRTIVVPLPILARVRMHLMPGILTFGIAAVLAIVDAIPWMVVLIPLVSTLTLILLPVHYTLTNAGIRLGWTEFRRWTEFAAVRRAPGGARLIGMQRGRGMHIWLSGSRGDDEFILYLKQTIRGAYKGDATIIPFPVHSGSHSSVTENGHRSTGVSAFVADRS